jgi:hypothetical protein
MARVKYLMRRIKTEEKRAEERRERRRKTNKLWWRRWYYEPGMVEERRQINILRVRTWRLQKRANDQVLMEYKRLLTGALTEGGKGDGTLNS